jgi:hypothetical protein
MQATRKRKPTKRESLSPDAGLSHPVSHPLRVRILEVANETDISPSDFINAGYVPADIARGRDFQNQLSMVAYHFRGLMHVGAVEEVGTGQVRGATEHFYRGKAVAYFTDEQWAALPVERRVEISRVMYQGMVARIESAMLAGTFEKRADRMIAWEPLSLDEQGWTEFHDAMTVCFAAVAQIKVDARGRLDESDETAIPTTFCMLGFESPPGAWAAGQGKLSDDGAPVS